MDRDSGRIRGMQRYTVILSPDPDVGGYTALCPAMPGAVTEGNTREIALRAMSDVMEVWIELAAENGHAPLPETPELIAGEIASVIDDRDQSGWDRAIETVMVSPAHGVLI
jgi:antitoxin HicB